MNCDASSAASAADFANSECPSGTVTIAAGGTSVTFEVSTRDDGEPEGSERFTVSITATTDGDFPVTFDESVSDTLVREMTLRDAAAVSAMVMFSIACLQILRIQLRRVPQYPLRLL